MIIPAYNAENTLKPCLESVFESDLKNCEVILVDDCSKDKTVGIARLFPCKIIRNKENCGAAAARNAGAEKASGEILLFVDSDVLVQKDLLKRTIEKFKLYPEIAAWVGTFSRQHRHNSFISQYKNLYFYYSAGVTFYAKGVNSAITAIKKDAFWKVNGFDAGKKTVAEDADLGMRLSKAGYLICLCQDIEVEHLKRLSFKSFVKNDFERGFSIAKSLFKLLWDAAQRQGEKKGEPFSFSQFTELYFSIPLPFVVIILVAAGFIAREFFFIATLPLFAFVLLNARFWGFLAKEKKLGFALAAAPITFFDMLVFFSGITLGFISAMKETVLK